MNSKYPAAQEGATSVDDFELKYRRRGAAAPYIVGIERLNIGSNEFDETYFSYIKSLLGVVVPSLALDTFDYIFKEALKVEKLKVSESTDDYAVALILVRFLLLHLLN